MRGGFAAGLEMHRDLCSASCLVKMQRYPVRQIGIQESGEAAASLSGM